MTTNNDTSYSGLSAAAQARIDIVRRIAVEVAGPAAVAVDRDSRYPREAMDALKKEKLLSAYVPVELGGFGASIVELGYV